MPFPISYFQELLTATVVMNGREGSENGDFEIRFFRVCERRALIPAIERALSAAVNFPAILQSKFQLSYLPAALRSH